MIFSQTKRAFEVKYSLFLVSQLVFSRLKKQTSKSLTDTTPKVLQRQWTNFSFIWSNTSYEVDVLCYSIFCHNTCNLFFRSLVNFYSTLLPHCGCFTCVQKKKKKKKKKKKRRKEKVLSLWNKLVQGNWSTY